MTNINKIGLLFYILGATNLMTDSNPQQFLAVILYIVGGLLFLFDKEEKK